MGIVQRSATWLGSAHRPALVGRIAMGFCQVGWAVRNGANPLKGVQVLPVCSGDIPKSNGSTPFNRYKCEKHWGKHENRKYLVKEIFLMTSGL
jgi:hypothetical protein